MTRRGKQRFSLGVDRSIAYRVHHGDTESTEFDFNFFFSMSSVSELP